MVLTQKPLIFLRIALLRAVVVLLGSLVQENEMGFSLASLLAILLIVFSASVTLARRILVRERIFTCTEVRKPSVAANVGPSTCFWRRREWINWNHDPDSPLILLSVQRSIKSPLKKKKKKKHKMKMPNFTRVNLCIIGTPKSQTRMVLEFPRKL